MFFQESKNKEKLLTRGACPKGELYCQRMFPLPLMPKGERSCEQGEPECCHQWQRGRLLIKLSLMPTMSGHWCQQLSLGAPWGAPWGLSNCQCQRRPFEFVQAQVWSPWSPWDNGKIPEHPVECLSTSKLVLWFHSCFLVFLVPQPCPIALECVFGGLKKLQESKWPFQWSFAFVRGHGTLWEAQALPHLDGLVYEAVVT